jgi:hypothetical protein
MSYKTRLLQHLTHYKHTVLRVRQPGIFRHKNRDLLKEHILPTAHAWLNLLEPARGLVQTYMASHADVKLHRYFHHLNSSQAFAFNLFFPFFEGGPAASATLLRALDTPGTLANWEPESVPNRKEGTNLDAKWSLVDGSNYICEVKLSEADFGKAVCDDHHKLKLSDIYEPVLNVCVAPHLLTTEAFFKRYQILRNIWHAALVPGSSLVFLMPRANKTLWKLLAQTLDHIEPEMRRRVRSVSIEDVLERLTRDGECPIELRRYAELLQNKYVPRTP